MSSEDMLGGGGSHYAPDVSTIGPLPWQLGGVYTHTLSKSGIPCKLLTPTLARTCTPTGSRHYEIRTALGAW